MLRGAREHHAAASRLRVDLAHGVGKRRAHARVFGEAHLDGHAVLEGRGLLVRAFYAQHGGGDALVLEPREVPADLVQVVHARLLHPTYVVGVVRDAHAVGLVIGDAVNIRGHEAGTCLSLDGVWHPTRCVSRGMRLVGPILSVSGIQSSPYSKMSQGA